MQKFPVFKNDFQVDCSDDCGQSPMHPCVAVHLQITKMACKEFNIDINEDGSQVTMQKNAPHRIQWLHDTFSDHHPKAAAHLPFFGSSHENDDHLTSKVQKKL